MATRAENDRLTEVGGGTLMGELLRRYWHPVGAATEFATHTVKPVRLLGEDLVLFRDTAGAYGLLDRRCPHRSADLRQGTVDDGGLRCAYCGWSFDTQGRCTSRPLQLPGPEASRARTTSTITAYPIVERSGLLFAYLGPDPAPLCPNWEPFTYENGFRQIVFSHVDCNWLQCQENSIDPVHFEWLHSNWSRAQTGRAGTYAPTHTRIEFEEFDYGFMYHRLLAGEDESSPNWTTLRLCILPNLFHPQSHFEWRVPIDETTTLSVVWHYQRVPIEREPYVQNEIPHWHAPIADSVTGRYLTSHTINQDIVAWLGQGVTSDRENEHLGRSDRGVVMLRRQLLADMNTVAAGGDPKGLIRDAAVNRCVALPANRRELNFARPLHKDEWAEQFLAPGRDHPDDYFDLLAGQPTAVRRAFEEAMGI